MGYQTVITFTSRKGIKLVSFSAIYFDVLSMHIYSDQKPIRHLSQVNGYGSAASEFGKFSPIVVEQESEVETQQRSLPTSRQSSPKEETAEVSSTPAALEQTSTVSTSMIQTASCSHSL